MFAPHNRPARPKVRPNTVRTLTHPLSGRRPATVTGGPSCSTWLANAVVTIMFVVLLPLASGPTRGQTPSFPFTIQGTQFVRNGTPVFLNMIGYQPLEPGQAIADALRLPRMQDDLRRLQAYQGGSDPIVLRVYPQPTATLPVRVPKAFYDGIRSLGFWVVRDIYFNADIQAPDAIAQGHVAIDAVINEVESQGGLDRIFAWEIGNEFSANSQAGIDAIQNFIAEMRNHIKARMAEPAHAGVSNWVTWASWPPSDPLRTGCSPSPYAGCNPIITPTLDYYAFNAYSYDPERMRDHQAGPVTGTPYGGYLAALRARLPGKPIVISESGLPSSVSAVGTDQSRIPPLYPSYRRGALTPEQVAEGLADRYWDARLSGAVSGFGVFEWLDEWHKAGSPAAQQDHPEEHFGLARFDAPELNTLRFKLQQDVIHDLYTLKLPAAAAVVTGLTPGATSLAPTSSTSVQAVLNPAAAQPVRFRWESSRGRIAGDGQTVQFHPGGVALGPITVTVVAIDANHNATRASTTITIEQGSPQVELLTFGVTRSSGRISNVDLSLYKVVTYVQTTTYFVQPFNDMTSNWIGGDGYFWLTNFAGSAGATLHAWVVPNSYVAQGVIPAPPVEAIAHASRTGYNDADNDLLPDAVEPDTAQDRYDDPDGDGATNLDEILAGRSPAVADNDADGDGLRDDWERRYFATLAHTATQDTDADGLVNADEQLMGTHPGRDNVDRDQDGLPDTWELARYGSLIQTASGLESVGVTNLDAYELASPPSGPVVTSQPLSQNVGIGQTALLTVTATGTAPLSYQWYTGASPSTASPLVGATSAAYTTPLLSAATSYWVRVTSPHGIANSSTATVTPASSPCSYLLSSTSTSAAPAGGSASVQVTTASGCTWTAASSVPWVVVTAGQSSTASGVVAYSVEANSGAGRTGTMVIAGQVFTLTQAAGSGSNPIQTRYLPEGATSQFFDTRLALLNPGALSTTATLRFLRTGEAPIVHSVPVPARTRATVDPKLVPGLAAAEFSTVVESDQLLVVDRTMSWDATGYGGHSETAVAAPALLWYLAEGATHSNFGLFYLIQNANASAATVRVRYLLPSGAPVERTYSVGPESRTTIWVNQIPELSATDVSAVIEVVNAQPVIVERAMYLSRPGVLFSAGHESAALAAPAIRWSLAEGATGAFFDDFILVANPTATTAAVRVTYLRPTAPPIVKSYSVAANSRFNIWVDLEDAALADTAVSALVESTNAVPILVERAMWWPGDSTTWHEAHNSAGATVTGPRWALADGEVGGPRATATYILLANTSASQASVRVTLLFEDGSPAERTFTVGGNSRFNVSVGDEFSGVAGRRFGAVIESIGATPAQLIVERATYWDGGGVRWAAGTNALATLLP